jgi:hypothetical protein
VSTAVRPLTWMGSLFAVGSASFAVGVPVSQSTALAPTTSAAIFFVGSLFFTSAATIQMWLAWVAMANRNGHGRRSVVRRILDVRDAAWSSAAIQWVGTLFFNVTTFYSLVDEAGRQSVSNQVIWRPDAFGSVLFLVSSAVACMPEVRAHRHGHVRGRSWTIAALNLLGSLFFGLSAIGAYVVPDTNELLNAQWSNGGTLLGALCFLVGALLVIPHRSTPSRTQRRGGAAEVRA